MGLSQENQCWVDDFRRRHGRSPRILHIGNIANNAYNNARLLNEAGLDCDVICYDYYHVMGCPEWEDADFKGDWKDDFQPVWADVQLADFSRPVWFAQGPVQLCIRYLVAYRNGMQAKAKRLWWILSLQNQTANLRTIPFRYRYVGLVDIVIASVGRFLLRLRRLADGRGVASRIAKICDQGKVAAQINNELARMLVMHGLLLLAIGVRILLSVISRGSTIIFGSGSTQSDTKYLGLRSKQLCERFKSEFTARSDVLTEFDFPPSLAYTPWQKLFSKYDYLIAYSTDPMIPMTFNTPYFAFEHGTIRGIPYEASAQGRLTALSYRLAQHVFVTNFDCVESAERLAPSRFTVINHPYDEDHGLAITGSRELREKLLSELESEFLFFHPTRQDWVEGTGYADKNNDTFLRAFADLRGKGFKAGLVVCAWGSNVDQSKALLDELHCLPYVRWVVPMAITPFERMCRAADIVVDQFKLGAFGGVVFKAMAVGTPILTYLDEVRLARQYTECPPVVNCRTSDEIIARMTVLISTPAELAKTCEASRAWMKKFHSKEMTVNAQVDQFRRHPPISEERVEIQ